MARYAIVVNGVVTNVIEADADIAQQIGAIEGASACIGDLWDGVNFTPAPPVQPSKEVQSALRREAYVAEADPIFFMSQRGEATQADWLAKIDEIKQRYPYPV